MSERIRDLKQQATDYVDSVDAGLKLDHYQQFLDLKFAELILVEVYAYILNATLDDQPWPDFAKVKRHFFGVEK
jgi:hypothetical protein